MNGFIGLFVDFFDVGCEGKQCAVISFFKRVDNHQTFELLREG